MKIYKQVIAAGSYADIAAVGNYVGVIGPTAARARIKTDRGLDVELSQGQHVRNIERFDSVRVYNLDSSSLLIEVSVGLGEIVDNQLQGSVTLAAATAVAALPTLTMDTSAQTVAGNDARKSIYVRAAAENVEPVYIGGESGKGLPILPGDTWQGEIAGAFQVVGAVNDKVYLLEVL